VCVQVFVRVSVLKNKFVLSVLLLEFSVCGKFCSYFVFDDTNIERISVTVKRFEIFF